MCQVMNNCSYIVTWKKWLWKWYFFKLLWIYHDIITMDITKGNPLKMHSTNVYTYV